MQHERGQPPPSFPTRDSVLDRSRTEMTYCGSLGLAEFVDQGVDRPAPGTRGRGRLNTTAAIEAPTCDMRSVPTHRTHAGLQELGHPRHPSWLVDLRDRRTPHEVHPHLKQLRGARVTRADARGRRPHPARPDQPYARRERTRHPEPPTRNSDRPAAADRATRAGLLV